MPHQHQVCHAHCPKGGGGGALLVVLAVVVVAAIARPVVHAATQLLEVALIFAASMAGVVVLGGVALLAVRVRRGRARKHQAMFGHAPARQAVTEPYRRAIEAPSVPLDHKNAVAGNDLDQALIAEDADRLRRRLR